MSTVPSRVRWMVVAAMSCALALGVAACGSDGSSASGSEDSSAASSDKPFRVLMVVDTTGPAKTYGQQDVVAMKAAVDYWNEQGGIAGRKITFDHVTTNGDPTTGVTALTKWVSSNGKPDYVFPGTTGGDVTALIPAIKRMGLLGLGVVDGSDGCDSGAAEHCPTYFSPGGTSDIGPKSAAHFMAEQGYKKVGLLIEQNSYSESEVPPLTEALKAEGVAYVTAEFPADSVDLSPQFAKLRDADVDAVFAAVLGPSVGHVAQARAKLGIVDSMPLIFDPGASALDLPTLAPPELLKNSFEQVHKSDNPKADLPGRDLLIKNAKPYGGVTQSMLIVAYAWDDLILVHHAVEQAGSTDPEAVRKALENLDEKSATDERYILAKKVEFTEDAHRNIEQGLDAYPVIRTGKRKNGMVYPLK